MKILIDLTALADNFTGIERYAGFLALQLVKNQAHTYILVFKEAVHPLFQEVCHQTNVLTMVLPRCKKLLFNQIRLPWAIRNIQADWYLFLAFPVPVLLWKKNMVSTIHDICCYDCPETMNGLSKWYFRISHRIALVKCRYLITISYFSKQRILDRLPCPEKKLLLVSCGVDELLAQNRHSCADISAKYQLPRSYILSLSTLEPRKNLSLLVKAYEALILSGKTELPLVLAGRKGWKTESLFSNISETVKAKIHFTGFVAEEDLPAVYQKAAFFVFPSRYEGFGLPPLEAMACGTPVLSSDAASMPEILGDACRYFQSENLTDLVYRLEEMTHITQAERETMIRTGLAQAQKYDWAEEANRLLNQLSERETLVMV